MKDCKLLLDTNVVIDFCSTARPCHDEAVEFVREAGAAKDIELIVLISSLKDLYYVLCRTHKDEAAAREAVATVARDDFNVVDLLAAYGPVALTSDEPDFEDGLVRAAAEALDVTAIVTRDERAFANSYIKAFTPVRATAFVRRLHPDSNRRSTSTSPAH